MYIQTWYHWCKIRKLPLIGEWLYRFGQRQCGRITGHHASKTEWGYNGGEKATVWCRWCNEMGSIPLTDAAVRFKNIRTIVWKYTGCDINHQPPEPFIVNEVPNE